MQTSVDVSKTICQGGPDRRFCQEPRTRATARGPHKLEEGALVILAEVPKEEAGGCRGAHGVVDVAGLQDVGVGGPAPHVPDDGEGYLNSMRCRGSSLAEAVREPGEALRRAEAAALLWKASCSQSPMVPAVQGALSSAREA